MKDVFITVPGVDSRYSLRAVSDPNAPIRRTRGRGIRPWLILLKQLGVIGFLGGLAALTALGFGGPRPVDQAGWLIVRDATKAIFWPCVFSGLIVAVIMGLILFFQHPRVFAAQRWFRLKVTLLLIALPTAHLTARGSVLRFYDAIDTGDLAALPALHQRVTINFALTLAVMACIAGIGRFKPRMARKPKR